MQNSSFCLPNDGEPVLSICHAGFPIPTEFRPFLLCKHLALRQSSVFLLKVYFANERKTKADKSLLTFGIWGSLFRVIKKL